jgi:phosphoribosyl-ATP pyrophosphohydrolase/phosphoribosyl-AMP cyclohydrolase
MTTIANVSDLDRLNWAKGDGLLPAVVQHVDSGTVLMIGWVNRESLTRTLESGAMTFWSRSKGRLWTKGETSGHVLRVRKIAFDCDADAVLVLAEPLGPTCHRGTASCFDDEGEGRGPSLPRPSVGFLAELDALIAARAVERPDGSYTTHLLEAGIKRIAQKVGEEGVETALAAFEPDAALLGEAADLVFHLLVLLRARGLGLTDLVRVLEARHARKRAAAG